MVLLRFTDKQYTLHNAAAKLKDHPFQEANLFISDDVSRKVREDQKKLKENHLQAIRPHEDVELAFIPWSVPAHIPFKKSDTVKLQSFSLMASAIFKFADGFQAQDFSDTQHSVTSIS